MTALDTLRRYHQQTKHRFQAYALGPEALDWDDQPAAFRRYVGAPETPLPLAAERYAQDFAALHAPACAALPPQAPTLAALGALLQLSLGLAAWKSNGVDRWALRCNPSSGNLHPVEGWLIAEGLAGLADGVHHYRPDDHCLELRAAFNGAAPAPRLGLALSSVMWREAWKYGERAFRYCQLDVGHAVACVAYAAALLGWRVTPVPLAGAELAHLLGLDRSADFPEVRRPWSEAEEPELLLALQPLGSTAASDTATLMARLATATWQGRASEIDKHPFYHWPIIDEVAAASTPAALPFVPPSFAPLPPLAAGATQDAAALIVSRRSGQRYDSRAVMPHATFLQLLDATLPRPQPPWPALGDDGHLALALFVHRVEGLAPGLYLLLRHPEDGAELLPALKPEYRFAARVDTPPHLHLHCLQTVEPVQLQRIARSISCHQDIASSSCFSLGMLARFDAPLAADASRYRALYQQAGLLGQALYLESEAAGYRATGIGCFFDDPLHELLGLTGSARQSLYHFAVGIPIEDTRLETVPPYPPEILARPTP
jgi:SagB-type dehydrogenase family enzyme